jgi:hypothetical protein
MIKNLVLVVCAAFFIASSVPADVPLPPCYPGCALNGLAR